MLCGKVSDYEYWKKDAQHLKKLFHLCGCMLLGAYNRIGGIFFYQNRNQKLPIWEERV